MNEKVFKICPYTKRELAKLYFPNTKNMDSAVANLRNLFKQNGDLLNLLHKSGYHSHNKSFTPRQVRIIVEFLGEP